MKATESSPRPVRLLGPVLVTAAFFGLASIQEETPVIRYSVRPDPASGTVSVKADVRFSDNWAYLKDFGQLRSVRCFVEDAEIPLSSERIRDVLVFTGPPRSGEARFEYNLNVVTESRPGYRKRLMGSDAFLLAREGLFLGLDQAETRPVEVSWELPAGWTLALGRPGRQPFAQTQKGLWIAGRVAGVDEIAVEDAVLRLVRLEGATRIEKERLFQAVDALFRRFWRDAGKLPGRHFGLAVFPRAALGGGTALGYDLAAEDSLATIIHEILHWWSNPSAPTWFREGVHSYMTIKFMALTGILKTEEFRAGIQEFYLEHQRVLKREGRLQSLADAERNYNRNAGGGDIYGLMPLLAFKLDREIQTASPKMALEDVFVEICRRPHRSVDILEFIRERTGYDPKPLFEKYFNSPIADAGELMR